MPSIRYPAVLIAGLVLWSAAYFYQAGGWNQNSRYDLARALAEEGTTRIDAYHKNTGDKARLGGHFYSDKAPGQSLVAVPAVLVGSYAAGAVGSNLNDPAATSWTTYAMTVLTSSLPVAVMVFFFFFVARVYGVGTHALYFAATTSILATPLWVYATLFMGHALAAACLLGATAAGTAAKRTSSGLHSFAVGLATGGLGGYAVVTEYPALVPAVLISVFALASAPRRRDRLLPLSAGLATGLGICAAIVMAYHQIAFGSAFTTPLRHLYLFRHVRENPFSWPDLGALSAIFFGAKRGLLPLAPVLVVGLVGIGFAIRASASRGLGILCAAVIVYYGLFNAAFATPLAGWSYGPRYMGAALPFWGLGLFWAWGISADRRWKIFLLGLALWGGCCSLLAVSTTAQPPEAYARPLIELLWPAFLDGDLALNHQSFLEPSADALGLRATTIGRDSFNLGQKLGLAGHSSLLPLAMGWGVFLWLFRRQPAQERARE